MEAITSRTLRTSASHLLSDPRSSAAAPTARLIELNHKQIQANKRGELKLARNVDDQTSDSKLPARILSPEQNWLISNARDSVQSLETKKNMFPACKQLLSRRQRVPSMRRHAFLMQKDLSAFRMIRRFDCFPRNLSDSKRPNEAARRDGRTC